MRRSGLREHFASIVSHELKSPLATTQQHLYALSSELSDQLTDDQLRRFKRIQTRIDDLMKLNPHLAACYHG